MAVAVKTKRTGRRPQATLAQDDTPALGDGRADLARDRHNETSIAAAATMAAGALPSLVGELVLSRSDPLEPALLEAVPPPMSHDGRRLANAPLSALGTAIDASSLIFDGDWYRRKYPDVAAAGLDPVRHYFDNGSREGRNPNAYFDTNWYVSNNADVAAAGLNPFLHYLLYGAREGRRPAPKRLAP